MNKDDLEFIRSNYEDNWNGESTKKLNEQVYKNALSILDKCDPIVLDKWEISLNNNGSLDFSGIDYDSMINLTANEFSYYITKGKKMACSNSEEFSINKIVKILEFNKRELK